MSQPQLRNATELLADHQRAVRLCTYGSTILVVVAVSIDVFTNLSWLAGAVSMIAVAAYGRGQWLRGWINGSTYRMAREELRRL